jgi:type IV secretion system protein VirD4
MGRERTEPPGAGVELALIAAGMAVVMAGSVTAAGARLSGARVSGGLGEWLRVTARLLSGESPRQAWGDWATGVGSPAWYWLCTALVLALAVSAIGAIAVAWRRLARPERERFGQALDARIAGRRDVVPLRIDELVPPTGRMLLGFHAASGRVLATEDRERHPLAGRRARRQGSRGSVALIGPTGSGKTQLATAAAATWDGPAVIVSVKRDLYDVTVAARAKQGEIAVFDPAASTGLPSARWSPLRRVGSAKEALITGRALAQAIPKSGVTSADYWAKHGEALLGSFMCVAGLSQLVTLPDADGPRPVNMQQIATWVSTVAMATEPTINALLDNGLDDSQPPRVQLMARHAATAFIGLANEDDRIRSSIYATARLAVDPWLEPWGAHTATDDPRVFYDANDKHVERPRFVDLEWLMSGGDGKANTLYLAAPQTEFERLSPVLGGLLAELKDSVHAWDIAGRRLKKPVLFLIDETGQLELGWLPSEVSTIAALGAHYVTCWQSMSQIQHRYGTLADTVLGGHRSKVFFAGVDDAATLRYLHTVTGTEHVARRSWSADVYGGVGRGRRSISESSQREDLIPNHLLRTMVPGEALLLHGTLPPIHLRAIRWWRERRLAPLFPPPEERPHVATCPTTGTKAPATGPVLDASTMRFSREQLPKASRNGRPVAPTAVKPRPPDPASPGQLRIPFENGAGGTTVVDDDSGGKDVVEAASVGSPLRMVNRVAGRCERCGTRVEAGAGTERRLGSRQVICCHPPCHLDAT